MAGRVDEVDAEPGARSERREAHVHAADRAVVPALGPAAAGEVAGVERGDEAVVDVAQPVVGRAERDARVRLGRVVAGVVVALRVVALEAGALEVAQPAGDRRRQRGRAARRSAPGTASRTRSPCRRRSSARRSRSRAASAARAGRRAPTCARAPRRRSRRSARRRGGRWRARPDSRGRCPAARGSSHRPGNPGRCRRPTGSRRRRATACRLRGRRRSGCAARAMPGRCAPHRCGCAGASGGRGRSAGGRWLAPACAQQANATSSSAARVAIGRRISRTPARCRRCPGRSGSRDRCGRTRAAIRSSWTPSRLPGRSRYSDAIRPSGRTHGELSSWTRETRTGLLGAGRIRQICSPRQSASNTIEPSGANAAWWTSLDGLPPGAAPGARPPAPTGPPFVATSQIAVPAIAGAPAPQSNSTRRPSAEIAGCMLGQRCVEPLMSTAAAIQPAGDAAG